MRLKNNLELRQLSSKTYVLELANTSCEEFNKIVTFNSSAAYLWQALCNKDFSQSDVVKLLSEKYSIDEKTAIEDATSLIDIWKNNSLIEE